MKPKPLFLPAACSLLPIVLLVTSVQLSAASWTAGRVVAWGNGYRGQTNVPAGLDDVVAIDAYGIDNGVGYSVALTSRGTVVAWGDDAGSGSTQVPPGIDNVMAISAGRFYVLALKRDGTITGWGGGPNGNPGAATNAPAGLSNVVAIAAGRTHSLALRNDGTVVAWGAGCGTNTPVGLANVAAISAQDLASLAVRSNGTVVAWGATSATNVPVGLTNAVAAYARYSAVIKSDGKIEAWGDYSGMTNYVGLTNVVALAYGLALRADGILVGCGKFYYPIPIGLSNVVALATGIDHAVAVTAGLRVKSLDLSTQLPIVRFHGFSGHSYAVEYSSNLGSNCWSQLPGGNIVGDGTDAEVVDTAPEPLNRFYRVRE